MRPTATLPTLSDPPGAGMEDAPLPVLEIDGLAYLGGLHDLPAERRTVTLIVGDDGIGIYRRHRELRLVDDDEIRALRAYERGPDTVFELHTDQGVGRFEGLLDQWDLARLEPYLLRHPPVPPPAVAAPEPRRRPAPSPRASEPEPDALAARRARLQELRTLYDDGLVPLDEYQRRCAEIIAEI